MAYDKSMIRDTISALKQQRDELALRIHLGAAEAKEECATAKEKLNTLTDDFEPLKEASQESAGNLIAALKLLGEEVRRSFDRVYKSLK